MRRYVSIAVPDVDPDTMWAFEDEGGIINECGDLAKLLRLQVKYIATLAPGEHMQFDFRRVQA